MAIHVRLSRRGSSIRATGADAADVLNAMAPRDEHTVAFCWESGLIETGVAVPKGAILIARGQPKLLANLIAGSARLAHDGKTWLVPGIPEAETDDAKVDALAAYLRWIRRRAGDDVDVGEGA